MTAAPAPLFSVIIPLEYHRGQWERGWRAWQTQTLDRSEYELILVVPRDFPERDRLPTQLGRGDRLEHADAQHDIGLCAIGAARARGRFLFFTESHCWPEPDVLELCRQAILRHPEWTGFSCRSVSITHNRLSTAEADMYEADITHGLQEHPWRKVLDQCFVTRRECYDECGGLRAELGHFAEWVLAAEYHRRGFTIGYLPEARLHHYYVGRLGELRAFTRDFVEGEMRYFAEDWAGPEADLQEVPPEWIGQGSWDPRLARRLFRIAALDVLAPTRSRLRRPFEWVATPLRWLGPALAGERIARARAAGRVWWALARARAASLVATRAGLSAAFRAYIAALIHQQRLDAIGKRRRARSGGRSDEVAARWDVFAPDNAGFHPIETFGGVRFRWSETAASLSAWIPAGPHRVRIDCLPVRCLLRARPRFFVDGRRISDAAVAISGPSIEIRFEQRESRWSTLAWSCSHFHAAGGRRWLGLPVERVAWSACITSPRPLRAAKVTSLGDVRTERSGHSEGAGF